MTKPMTDERLAEIEQSCISETSGGLLYTSLHATELLECVREIRRLREDNERLRKYNDTEFQLLEKAKHAIALAESRKRAFDKIYLENERLIKSYDQEARQLKECGRNLNRVECEHDRARELLGALVAAADEATATYPEEHQFPGAYIVAFGEYERLGELEEKRDEARAFLDGEK